MKFFIFFFSFDAKVNSKSIMDGLAPKVELPKTAQFGVSLKFVNENNQCTNYIPNIVELCVSSLSIDECK